MEKTKQQKAKDFIINNGVIIVMFILVIYTGLTSDNFLTRNNLMNILMNMSSRLVIALGIAGCVITAGCDLSAGRMIGFAACIAGTLLQRIDYSGKFFPDMQPMNVFLALIVVMAICAAFGSITGVKQNGELNTFVESADNTGADASLFGWTGYNLSAF